MRPRGTPHQGSEPARGCAISSSSPPPVSLSLVPPGAPGHTRLKYRPFSVDELAAAIRDGTLPCLEVQSVVIVAPLAPSEGQRLVSQSHQGVAAVACCVLGCGGLLRFESPLVFTRAMRAAADNNWAATTRYALCPQHAWLASSVRRAVSDYDRGIAHESEIQ